MRYILCTGAQSFQLICLASVLGKQQFSQNELVVPGLYFSRGPGYTVAVAIPTPIMILAKFNLWKVIECPDHSRMKPIALCKLLSISIRLREDDPMRYIKNTYFPPEEDSVRLTQPIVYKFPTYPARPAHK